MFSHRRRRHMCSTALAAPGLPLCGGFCGDVAMPASKPGTGVVPQGLRASPHPGSAASQNWGRVPALNTNATFINDLAAMVLEKLPSAAPRPGYMLSANEGINLGPPSGARHLPHCLPRAALLSQVTLEVSITALAFHHLRGPSAGLPPAARLTGAVGHAG